MIETIEQKIKYQAPVYKHYLKHIVAVSIISVSRFAF